MKKVLYSFAIFGALFFSGCALKQMVKMAKDQDLKVNPNPLELHGDMVNFDLTATLPVKMLKKNLVYALDSKYEYEGKSYNFDRIEFVANDIPNRDVEQPHITKSFSFKYVDGMEKGNVVVTGTAVDPAKKKELPAVPATPVAPGLIMTSRLVKDVYYSAFVNYDYIDNDVQGFDPREEIESVNVNFYFEQGKSVLKPGLSTDGKTNKAKQDDLSAFIAAKNITRTVTITGTHSPEGAERINTGLSSDRAKRIQAFYTLMMKKYDYKGLADSIKFIIKPVVEDWTAFRTALTGYNKLTYEQKQEYISVLDYGTTSFVEKEKKLHKISTYKSVFNDLYPGLRTAKTDILKIKDKHSAAEIAILAKAIVDGKAKADTLTYGEMAYAAFLTPSLSEKEQIFLAASKQYPHFASYNNLGAVYLSMAIEDLKAGKDASANLDKAVTDLQISVNKRDNNAYAHGNLGVAYVLQHKNDQGIDELSKGLQMSPAAKHAQGFNGVKGAAEIKLAKYEPAIASLSHAQEGNDVMFDLGLAQLLKKEYDPAKNSFADVVKKSSDYALAYYGAAIVAARTGNAADLATNIKKAVDADPALKQKALTDLEFVKFVDSEGFRNALK
jgi:tetratricopeptide (TPR) repeat protein